MNAPNATVTPLSITLVEKLRLDGVTIPAGSVVKYARMGDVIAVRLADGRGMKVTPLEWRLALLHGKHFDSEAAADLMGCRGKTTRKTQSIVQSRLFALGYETVCPRCGGGGHFSFNLMTGTICFSCNGSGRVVTKITANLIADVVARTAAGELEPYLANIRAKVAAKKLMGPLLKQIDATWRGVGSVHEGAAKFDGKLTDAGLKQWVNESADFRAIILANDLHTVAGDVERGVEFRGRRDYEVCVKELQWVLTSLQWLNGAWAAYDGADRMRPRI